ncbi:tetratricopeptide repeat protein [Reyranella sp.]|uniref:tetratricopeptide repeat protein n=1 Tax=Reyranella sp. TaxID=1929291 RepID=UPI003BA8FC0B
MHKDLHGLTLSTDSGTAVDAYDRAVMAYLKYRTDAARHLAAALKADGNFAMAHVLRGYFAMLSYNRANVGAAAEALAEARSHSRRTTTREAAHVEALSRWVDGDLDRMLDLWETICAEHPHDVLAFRLHHFNAFWLGRPAAMQAAVERVFPHWSDELAGWGMVLACRAFAHEEAGNYTLAEGAGRLAIEVDPGDLWAAHAVAHVLEMQGRRVEGIDWLKRLEPKWGGANNLKHHLFWHRAMFHLERREFDDVLSLYDHGFRDLGSPLTQAMPDMYIDVQNAISMLFRLQRQGVDVGDRWVELADKAEARIGDCLSAFTLPHWMMALMATGREAAGERLLEAMRAFARGNGTVERLVGKVALPVCEAVQAHGQGRHADALRTMRPVIGEMFRLGGSHAQQDVLEQVFLDSALRAESGDDVRLVLERVAGRHPVPPSRRVGYATAAARHSF